MNQNIRAKIVEVINGMTNSPIQAVYSAERSDFPDGIPAVTVSPSDSAPDYSETHATSQKAVFMFKVRAYYPFVDGQETADNELDKVVDALLELFRDKKILGTVADWVAPAPSVWGYEQKNNGLYRKAEITLQVIKYY